MSRKNHPQRGRAGFGTKARSILRLASPVLLILLIGGIALAFNKVPQIVGLMPDITLTGDSNKPAPAMLGGTTRPQSSRHVANAAGSSIDLGMAIDPGLFNASLFISEADTPSSSNPNNPLIPRLRYSSTSGQVAHKGHFNSYGYPGNTPSSSGNSGGSFSGLSGGFGGSSGGSSGGGSTGGGSPYTPALLSQLFSNTGGQSGDSGGSSGGGASYSGSGKDAVSPAVLIGPTIVVAARELPTFLDGPDVNGGGGDDTAPPVPNPEPGTLVLGGMGLASLIAARRRMKAGKREE